MAGPNTGNPYNAKVDAWGHPSITVVSGTVGTADTLGTAEQFRVGGNPATGAIYVDSSLPTTPLIGTLQNATGTGNGTALTTTGYTTVALQITNTFVGTVVFEATLDNSNWVSYNMVQDSGNAVGSIATSTGIFRASAAGILGVRARVASYTSGTVQVLGRLSNEVLHPIVVNAALPFVISFEDLSNTTGAVTQKPVNSTTYTPSAFDSGAYGTAGTIKASAGILYGFTGYNSGTNSQFIQIFNATSIPANGGTPVLFITVGPQSNFSWESGQYGKSFSTGMIWSNSTTGPTKTIGTADTWINALYI